jgi:hypothetical protein
MATEFLVVGLPDSFTSEQLRQFLAPEAPHVQAAEMLSDTVATGVGYVQISNREAGQRAMHRFLSPSTRDSLGVRPLVCGGHSGAFHALSKRWDATRAPSINASSTNRLRSPSCRFRANDISYLP